MTARVVIAQPYVPQYRVAFFEKLREKLAEDDINCVVAAGVARGDQAARGDAVHPDWLIPVRTLSLPVAHRSIDFDITPAPWRNTDATILGLEGSSLPVYRALLSSRLSSVRVGLWGHVRPYVNAGNKVDLWLEKQQMFRAHHIFAYTAGGAQYARMAGIHPNKITAVMNSIDTSALERAREAITPDSLGAFSIEHKIDPAKTFCFIGGMDESKRIKFLVEALDSLWQYDKDIRVLVGGNGPQKHLLGRTIERGQVIDLGYLTTDLKALAISASRGILMPGRIGLVAVDALVMKRPIITTHWPYHAPEAEYLTEGKSRYTTNNDVESFVAGILGKFVADRKSYDFEALTPDAWQYPTMESMVNNYADGVHALLK